MLATPSRFASPESYTPEHLAERILTSKVALEGERKQVTVLFADLKGSMELLADRDPEEARTLLDPVLEHMMEAVHRYEGTVNQVMGDGIMALFGAPLAHEDHAVRACYAALRMQESVKRYAEGVFRSHGALVQIRVGLNSGEVVVRAIGSDLHMDYTAVGQTTHLAARMEQLAAPGTVLLAPATLQLAEGYVHVASRGPVAIKGLPDPVEVFELSGASAVRSRLQASAARGFTRFIGRDAEMEQLRRALEQARSGHGQLVAVVGEAGLGKSRLFYEFTHSHRTQDWRILESGAASYGKATSYLPAIDLLKVYFHITDRDSHRDIQAKVTGAIVTLDRVLESAVAPMLELLDVPTDDTQWTNLDPQQRRKRTLDAVMHLLLRETQVQPLLVVFEDLHWIDSETQALLDGLVESLPATRLLLLVNYRPEYSHGWGSKTCYTQLRLDAFPAETASELLDALLGRDPSVDPLKPMLAARTGGNPLFLEESVRSLVEIGALAGERGAYRLTRAVEAIQVPATVQAILATRIDRLPPEEKALLQVAAVIGKDVPFVLLRVIAEEPEDRLGARLAHLQTAELLYEAALFPDLEYTFKHALTHEVAYSSLLHERRRTLHLKILEALEGRSADRTTEDVERLARHALGAESWGKAASYLRQAGRRATAQSAYRAGAGWLEEALRALQRLPESPDVLAQAIDARLELRVALIPLGRYHDALDLMREAEGLAMKLGDRARLGSVLVDLCARLRNVLGEHHQAIAVGRRALAIAAERGDRALELDAQYRTGQAYFAIGDYREAIDLLSRATTRGGERPDQGLPFAFLTSWSHAWVAIALANLGEFLDAMSHATEALRIAEGADHPFTLAEALTALGGVCLAQGELDRAVGTLERGLAVVREWKLDPSAALSRLGYAYALSGRLPEALRFLDEVAKSTTTMSSMGVGRAIQLAWLAEAYLLDQQLDVALERAQQAMCLAQGHQERGHEAWIHRLLGEIASRRGPPDAQVAEDHFRRALTLATELGMRPLAAHCRLGLGTLFRRPGRLDQAGENLATATAMYREMDMRFWLEKSEAGLKELGSQRGAPQ